MNLLQLKTIISNLHRIRWRNIFFLILAPGTRTSTSVLLAFGNFYYGIKSSSKINIRKGTLSFNADFSKPNPFMGVLKMYENSQINVEDGFVIYAPCHLVINHDAKFNLGSVYINKNSKIRCYSSITIGHGVAISENFTVWDTDAHAFEGQDKKMTQPVKIGNHVWIGMNVTVLKGVKIGDHAVIAARGSSDTGYTAPMPRWRCAC